MVICKVTKINVRNMISKKTTLLVMFRMLHITKLITTNTVVSTVQNSV